MSYGRANQTCFSSLQEHSIIINLSLPLQVAHLWFANSFDPDQAPQNLIWSKPFDILMGLLKEFWEKLILKKGQVAKQNMHFTQQIQSKIFKP